MDQCRVCTCFGDLPTCQSTECTFHETWYNRTQLDRIAELEALVRKLMSQKPEERTVHKEYECVVDGVTYVTQVSDKDCNACALRDRRCIDIEGSGMCLRTKATDGVGRIWVKKDPQSSSVMSQNFV